MFYSLENVSELRYYVIYEESILDVPEHIIANKVPSDYLSLILKGAIFDDCYNCTTREIFLYSVLLRRDLFLVMCTWIVYDGVNISEEQVISYPKGTLQSSM